MDYESGGRPRTYTGQAGPLPTVTARLTLWHVRAARRLGSGNASEGIRIAIEMAASGVDTLPKPERAGDD